MSAPIRLVAILISLEYFACLQARMLGAFVLPHGGIAADPDNFNTTNSTAKLEAHILHDTAEYVGRRISDLSPDLIFLSTPHGISDSKEFLLYYNTVASGTGGTDNCKCPPCCVNVSVDLDSNVTKLLLETLETKQNISGATAFGPPGESTEPFPLRWGEVIPLSFISRDTLKNTKVVILSQPSRRYKDVVTMVPELIDLGGSLFDVLELSKKKYVVIISCDLAHTHDKNGPYGFSTAAAPFDEACGNWAETLDGKYLTVTAAGYVEKALSCGYTGLVMLHGMLIRSSMETAWKPTLLANYHPSYYGMMVASFENPDIVYS